MCALQFVRPAGRRKKHCLASLAVAFLVGVAQPAQGGANAWSPVGPSGASWSAIGGGSSGRFPFYATTGDRRLYRTRNGVTWLPAVKVPEIGAGGCAYSYFVVNEIVFAQDPTYCKALFRSADAGDTWTATLLPWASDLTLSLVSNAATQPTSVYATFLFHLGVAVSEDGGGSWSLSRSAPLTTDLLIVDPANAHRLFALTEDEGLMIGTEGAYEWTMAFPGIIFQALFRQHADLFLEANSGAIFKSSDDGATWMAADSGLGNMSRDGFTASPTLPSRLYARVTPLSGSPHSWYSSLDGGASWHSTSIVRENQFAQPYVSGQNSSVVYSGQWVSVDGSRSWNLAPGPMGAPTPAPHPVFMDAGMGATLYAPTFGVGRRHGQQWSTFADYAGRAVANTIGSSRFRPGIVYALAHDGQFLRSVDYGSTWSEFAVPDRPLRSPPDFFAADSSGGNVVYLAGNAETCVGTHVSFCRSLPFLQRSDDDGRSWLSITAGLPGPAAYGGAAGGPPAILAFAVDAFDPEVAYCGTFDGLYTYGPGVWRKVGGSLPQGMVTSIVTDRTRRNVAYAFVTSEQTSGVYITQDGGVSWTSRSAGLPFGASGVVAIDERDESLYVAIDGTGVFRSANMGGEWTSLNAGLDEVAKQRFGAMVADPVTHDLYLSTATGLQRYTFDASNLLVSVVEFYNETFDHYFISADASEIADLDAGRHAGWRRTGQAFLAYGTQVGNASPVCRFYIPPAYGDSHFYSASPAECNEVLTRLPHLVEESSNVFYIDLPDPDTGACPDGTDPVYRLWNHRSDSNHRYVVDASARDLMSALGSVKEGYGEDAVAVCSP